MFALKTFYPVAASLDENYNGQLELDSHADSPVLGKTAVIIHKTGITISVNGFSDELGRALSVPVIYGAITYDAESSGETHILVLRNSLHLPAMNKHLIPPFMMRLSGVKFNECAKFLANEPNISHHIIYFRDK